MDYRTKRCIFQPLYPGRRRQSVFLNSIQSLGLLNFLSCYP